ncbi:hypothetical protein [Streptomyces sp.]|uniref:hypothetical protein n=1 Tax=Streptomyces sp. TaxID=1931 RepID=UPI002D76C701|nr:hypothetical protein [Streptomyces sp.]HET6356707.1 hypothetical protein [Streptomyces sp.]
MAARDAETLAQLVSERTGQRGSTLPTFDQMSERSVDPVTGYRPSANLLWKIAKSQSVKVSPELIRAIATGFSLDLERVQQAAARQYLGWQVDDPFDMPLGDNDAVARVAHKPGVEASDLPRTRDFLERAARDELDQGD